jgi:ABC-2 type transport system ATP-binding protein
MERTDVSRRGAQGGPGEDGVAVRVESLTKAYGGKAAVDGLSFTAEAGRIFALLGPNGAGKTTALECVEGLKRPDSGLILVAGEDPAKLGRRAALAMGVQLQVQGLPAAMTPREAFALFSGYRGLRADLGAAERFGLGAKLDAPYGSLSEGQKRRLSLALATAHKPKVLILDEPTASLDVESRTELHAIILELKQEGTAIILASHDMAEVEKLADTALVMVRGREVDSGSPRELRARSRGASRILCASRDGRVSLERPELPGAAFEAISGDKAAYRATEPGRAVAALVSWLEARGDELSELSVEAPSLEDRFMEITRRAS